MLWKVKSVRVKDWLLGGSFRFSTKSNDPLNGYFYIFQIQPTARTSSSANDQASAE